MQKFLLAAVIAAGASVLAVPAVQAAVVVPSSIKATIEAAMADQGGDMTMVREGGSRRNRGVSGP